MTDEKNVYDESYNQPPVDNGFNNGAVAPHTSSMLAKPGEKGSLPVLEAFQEFLEDERKRSRNRMFVLSAIFTLLLICVIFCGLFIGSVFLGKMKDEMREVRFNSETEILKLQNETLRTLNNRGGNPGILPYQNPGMSDGQKAQVSLMMNDSKAEIDKLQAKIAELQNSKSTSAGGPNNSAISNALVNVMREVSKMRKDMNSGASYYTPIKHYIPAPPPAPVVSQVAVVQPIEERPVMRAPVMHTPVVANRPVTVPVAPVIVKALVEEEPLPDTISVTIKPVGNQGIVCALPIDLD
jgi:predicted nucleic acid-binding Zn ribbon protein